MQRACGSHVLSTIHCRPKPIPNPIAGRRMVVAHATHRLSFVPSPASPIPASTSSIRVGSSCPCCLRVSKRSLLLGGSTALLPVRRAASSGPSSDPADMLERVHPSRSDWYEEFLAKASEVGMRRYEAEIATYKEKLFSQLTEKSKKVLELGVGTGPNLKYYASAADRYVIGVDPNKQMEKYARASAEAAGLQAKNFSFIRGVGEALDVSDNTMDAVVGTLVLCSVNDVALTLREIRRVLKPGGLYLFIEHVAARDGSFLRFVQGILDPLQQFVSDGCHLTRETGKQISEAGFSNVSLQMESVSSIPHIRPHVYGIASK